MKENNIIKKNTLTEVRGKLIVLRVPLAALKKDFAALLEIAFTQGSTVQGESQ